jgi:hypothetical protein
MNLRQLTTAGFGEPSPADGGNPMHMLEAQTRHLKKGEQKLVPSSESETLS